MVLCHTQPQFFFGGGGKCPSPDLTVFFIRPALGRGEGYDPLTVCHLFCLELSRKSNVLTLTRRGYWCPNVRYHLKLWPRRSGQYNPGWIWLVHFSTLIINFIRRKGPLWRILWLNSIWKQGYMCLGSDNIIYVAKFAISIFRHMYKMGEVRWLTWSQTTFMKIWDVQNVSTQDVATYFKFHLLQIACLALTAL